MIKEKGHRPAKTGHMALDAALNDKYESASAKGIQMEWRLEVPAEIFVEDENLCAILENLLGNALDALQKLPEEERRISLIVRLTKGAIFIRIEHPYRGESVMDSQRKIQRSKAGDYEMRLSSVKRMAEKYCGDVSINYEEGVLWVTALLLQKEILH